MNKKQLETLKRNNEESREFTRSCVSFALFSLLSKDTDYKDISITRLCNVAGVSRAAFYRNYESIDDVLNDKIKEAALKLASKIESDVYNNWVAVFSLVDEERRFFEAIFKAGIEYKILEVFLSLVPKTEDSKTIQSMWLAIFYSMIVKWIKDGEPKKPEEMAKLAYKYTKNIPLVSIDYD